MTLILLPVDLKTRPRRTTARRSARGDIGLGSPGGRTTTQTQTKVLLNALRAKDLL